MQAHSAQIWTVRFSPDGKKFVTASDGVPPKHNLRVWDP
ncbi:MAG: hypothetical protein ACU0DI_14715 [Paracoccaceae bacterium]